MTLQLTLAARYLAGRKLRTFLTTLAVIFGVLVIFGMNIILPTMLAAIQANTNAVQGAVDLTIVRDTGSSFPQEVLSKVQAVQGVRAAAASLSRIINLPVDFFDKDTNKTDAISALTLVGIDPYAAKTIHTYPVIAGRYLENGDSVATLITQSLADALAVKVGGHFSIPTVNGVAQLTVVGILLPRLGPGNEEVLMTLPEAQTLTGETGKVNTIDVTLNSNDEAQRARIAENIKAALGGDYTTGSLPSGGEMITTLQIGQAAFSLFGLLALFMGAFIIFNTFRTVVTERQHDIGLLRAVGASRHTIIGMILAEGLMQGLFGTAIGLILGYLFGAGMLGAVGPMMGQFLNLKIGAPVVSPAIVIVSSLLGVGVTVFAGVIPAINASRITPLEALRLTGGDGEFRGQARLGFVVGLTMVGLALLAMFSNNSNLVAPGVILFLVGMVMVAPALVRPVAFAFGKLLAVVYARQGTGELAQGNLIRHSSRAAVTASAIMLGLAVIVAAGGVVTSMTGTLRDVMKKSLDSDYLFIPPSIALWSSNVGAGHELVDRLRALDGVAEISSMRFAGSVVSAVGAQSNGPALPAADGKTVSLLGIDPIVFPKVGGLYFQQGDESAYQEMLKGHVMIVNGAFITTTGAKVGDQVVLVTPGGKASYRIAAVATDALNAKITTAFITQTDMLADFGSAEDVFIQLNLKPGAEVQAADRQIKAIATDYPQFQVIAGKVYYQQIDGEINGVFAGLYFILVLLALPALIAMLNTLAIGVIERTREIGMLRAVGATKKQIRTMVVAEALLLAGIGTAFGILCGLYLGYVFVNALEPIFPLGYYFPMAGILVAISMGLIFGALAAIIPARQAARMNVVEALRYE